MPQLKIRDTDGVLFLVPTIALILDTPDWMHDRLALVWGYRQLILEW